MKKTMPEHHIARKALLRVIFFSMVIWGGCNNDEVIEPPPPPPIDSTEIEAKPGATVHINSPQDSSCIKQHINAEGNVHNLPTGSSPWVFVQDRISGRFHAQQPVVLIADSLWSTSATVGYSIDEHQVFRISVAVVSEMQGSYMQRHRADTTFTFKGGTSPSTSISVTRDSVGDRVLGIYSETAPDRLSDHDSFIGTYTGGGGTVSLFVDDNTEMKEGGISKKTTMTVDGSRGQWAGWFVQWGISGTSENTSRDMSGYRGGKLTFWIRSPINLLIGIRSGNVFPGSEISTIMLNSYPSFQPDNEWHKLCVPLSDFTDPGGWADLSKIRIFFNVASNVPSGGTGGVPKTFWIDDVRWEKECGKTNRCP